MGNGYDQHFRHQSLHIHYRSTFLPMLCSRPSIKDVALPKWEDRSSSISKDPLSPKIGCMGQVKRSNRIVGLPSSNKLNITRRKDITTTVKYSKLKRIFSMKTPRNTAATPMTHANICTRRQAILRGASGVKKDDGKENSFSVNIDQMDPPLPVVIKKVQKPADGEEMNSLWNRRCGGAALKNLQLQQIQLKRSNVAPTTC
ncbi:hypothetical protein K2173_023114 [Erythroxylum novogranatense]|uniref:Uncharacterized protein n=1 Tax=Erythroxylum novogranatense TaxID=1862640 RepID=A0AAV8T8A5_9ROSI|nr:hypothetical protein K2173_023114 [Erythroxylum novogranatense]